MSSALDKAQWPRREGLAALTQALEADNLRWVGGAIRDTLLGHEVADVDAATLLLPDVVRERCQSAGIRTVPTGIEHGTVTAILPDGPVEVTTVRKDVATDGRRATVEFAKTWQEDAARRDFTINALFAHPETLEIEDYFGGLDDLATRRVRFIGNAKERIREDHLRILRYFRFQARFGDEPDAEALAACEELAGTLKGLSRERVAMELLSLLGLPDPHQTIDLMAELGVLGEILPEARRRQRETLAALMAHEQAQAAEPDAIRRLAALLPASDSVAEAVAARLRLSRAQRGRLACAASRQPSDALAPRALAYRQGMACARDRLLISGHPISEIREWSPPQFPIKGRDVIARGVEAGPQVARILQETEAQWIEAGFPQRDETLAILSKTMGN